MATFPKVQVLVFTRGNTRIHAAMSGKTEPGAGFEPATFALQERCSGQLSYPGGAHDITSCGEDRVL